MPQDPLKDVTDNGAAKFLGAVVGFVFAGIGVTVLVFMWAAPFGDFGSPPLFFRIFASFIAIAFVAFGGTMGVTALRGGGGISAVPRPAPPTVGPAPVGPAGGYRCPNCGAPLGDKAEVSPSGDVKCPFCGRWFNVNRTA